MIKIKITFVFLLTIFFSKSIISNGYLDFKEAIKKHYESFLYKTKKSEQDFIIKEEIKKFDQNLFVLKKEEIKNYKININHKLILKDKEWKIEKLYFIESFNMEILSPEPKLPRQYYKLKVEFDEGNYNYLLNIKYITFSSEIAEHILQFYPLGSKKINFEIEFFLFTNDIIGEVLKKEYDYMIYKIYFLHDTSPLNTFDRKIEVYGVIKEIK